MLYLHRPCFSEYDLYYVKLAIFVAMNNKLSIYENIWK